VIDGGLATIPVDTYDIDDDANLNELAPDADRKPRVRGAAADMGAYERYAPGECPGDINGSGIVDADDLVIVILTWGPCPQLPEPCHANVATPSNNAVDSDDLVVVILGWGPCPDNQGIADSMPQSIQDCMDKCAQAGLEGQQWSACFAECYAALCAAGIINCDD
jgi:hypothetical protein